MPKSKNPVKSNNPSNDVFAPEDKLALYRMSMNICFYSATPIIEAVAKKDLYAAQVALYAYNLTYDYIYLEIQNLITKYTPSIYIHSSLVVIQVCIEKNSMALIALVDAAQHEDPTLDSLIIQAYKDNLATKDQIDQRIKQPSNQLSSCSDACLRKCAPTNAVNKQKKSPKK